ncbi:MAG: hypothetical protein ACYC3X_30000 [Pirellulaceae bacterium]
MNALDLVSGCACCGINRRRFLASGCAACATAASLALVPRLGRAASASEKTRIRVIYSLHADKQTGPDWPNVGFDFNPVMKRVEAQLQQQCPDFEFVYSLANGPEKAKEIVEADKAGNLDGYLVYQMNCWNQVVQTAAATGKPVLYADFQYGGSGGFLVYTAGFLRANAPNVGFVASSRIEDLIEAVKCFALVKKGGSVQDFVAATKRIRMDRTAPQDTAGCLGDPVAALAPEECLRRMKESRILAVGGGWPGIAPAITPEMGIGAASRSTAI